jgi:hypothetical protein
VVSFLYTSCMLRGAFTLLINVSTYLSKKKVFPISFFLARFDGPSFCRGSLTWLNNWDVSTRSRIDILLVSLEWEAQFPGVPHRSPTLFSNHFLILLDCGDFHGGSRPFKFENMWLKSEGFVDRVKQWWDSYLFQCSPGFILVNKLKALKADLKRWNEDIFGNVDRKKKILLQELHVFYVIEEERFYKELFTEQCSWRPMVDGLSFDSIDEVEASWQEREFEEMKCGRLLKQ